MQAGNFGFFCYSTINILAFKCFCLRAEDFSTSADDYLRALSILEKMDEAQSRHIAELYP